MVDSASAWGFYLTAIPVEILLWVFLISILAWCKTSFCEILFYLSCNINAIGAIILLMMAGVMAEIERQTENDDLVMQARSDGDALGQLYDLYYERILRFCVHRLFFREIAEDVTSTVFLQVARQIGSFAGRTEADFRNWIYAIAVNQANDHIRKITRREKLLANVPMRRMPEADCCDELDWPVLYKAISKLKPKHQTIIVLRFFENMDFKQIAKIINTREVTVRVTLHRILKKLRDHLQTAVDGGR